MNSLSEYAAALEASGRPGDRAIASYIRSHEVRLKGWIAEAGRGLGREDRAELVQVALLAVAEVVAGAETPEEALSHIHEAVRREGRRSAAWNARRTTPAAEEE